MGLFSLKDAASTIPLPKNGKKDQEPLDMFRCTPMNLLQLYIPSEAAQITIAELGQLELLQFRDVSWALFFVNFIILAKRIFPAS
jgi:hypothetical protein